MNLEGKNIFITSCGGLGDLVVCTPALRRLKEKYRCHITFLCQKKYEDVLKGLPYIDKVVCIQRGRFLGRYRCIFSGKLHKQDAIVFTDWHPILLLAAHLFCISLIAGVARAGHKFTKYLTKTIINQVFANTHYAALSNAMMYGDALGVELDGDMTKLDIGEPDRQSCISAGKLLSAIGCRENNYILLAPFAALEQRNWPIAEAKKFVEIAEEHFHVPVVVMGGNGDSASAAKISKYNLAGKTTVPEMIYLIKNAKMLVSVDSGPMHIAGAVGTPVIALFSKDLPSRWAPRHKCVPVYLGMDCSPCDDETAKKCQHVTCMRGITAEMVLNSCDKLVH